MQSWTFESLRCEGVDEENQKMYSFGAAPRFSQSDQQQQRRPRPSRGSSRQSRRRQNNNNNSNQAAVEYIRRQNQRRFLESEAKRRQPATRNNNNNNLGTGAFSALLARIKGIYDAFLALFSTTRSRISLAVVGTLVLGAIIALIVASVSSSHNNWLANQPRAPPSPPPGQSVAPPPPDPSPPPPIQPPPPSPPPPFPPPWPPSTAPFPPPPPRSPAPSPPPPSPSPLPPPISRFLYEDCGGSFRGFEMCTTGHCGKAWMTGIEEEQHICVEEYVDTLGDGIKWATKVAYGKKCNRHITYFSQECHQAQAFSNCDPRDAERGSCMYPFFCNDEDQGKCKFKSI